VTCVSIRRGTKTSAGRPPANKKEVCPPDARRGRCPLSVFGAIVMTKLGGTAFKNAAEHLEKEVVGALYSVANRTGRQDLFDVYLEALSLFERFLKERSYEAALTLEASYRPH